jgi:hypothetical protein
MKRSRARVPLPDQRAPVICTGFPPPLPLPIGTAQHLQKQQILNIIYTRCIIKYGTRVSLGLGVA